MAARALTIPIAGKEGERRTAYAPSELRRSKKVKGERLKEKVEGLCAA
jgi:hypothetical protein